LSFYASPFFCRLWWLFDRADCSVAHPPSPLHVTCSHCGRGGAELLPTIGDRSDYRCSDAPSAGFDLAAGLRLQSRLDQGDRVARASDTPGAASRATAGGAIGEWQKLAEIPEAEPSSWTSSSGDRIPADEPPRTHHPLNGTVPVTGQPWKRVGCALPDGRCFRLLVAHDAFR